MARSRKSLLLPAVLVAAVLPLAPGASAAPGAPARPGAVAAADVELATSAGGSVLVVADGPQRNREEVAVRVTRADGAPLPAADVRIDLGTTPVTAAYQTLPATAAGAAVTASARVSPVAGTDLAIRPTFFVRGDYRVEVTVGGRPAGTANVLVSSAFERIGFVEAGTEIVSATPDGRSLVTTDGTGIGIVDITDPAHPGDVERVPVSDGVTSVDVTPDGRYALVATTSSVLGVVDIATATLVRRIPIPAGADSVKVSPDGRYGLLAVDAQEQGVAAVTAVDIVGAPAEWTTRRITFDKTHPAFDGAVNLAPENIDIDAGNRAALGFQSLEAVAVVDLVTGATLDVFGMGTSTRSFDPGTDDGGVFTPGPVRTSGERAPDGIAIYDGYLLTPNEEGGARSWSVFDENGTVVFDSGAELEQAHSYQGMYRENDPEFEQVETGVYGTGADAEPFAFIGSERWGTLSVYRIDDPEAPRLTQIFGSNIADDDPRPEGIVAVPGRDLVIVANEDENSVVIFRRVQERRGDGPLTLTSHTVGSKEITGWAAAGPDSLVAVSLGRRLLRASVTPTEVVVDGSVPVTGVDSTLATLTTNAVAVEPGTGNVWLPLTVEFAGQGDPVEDTVARVGAHGAVVETIDLSPGVLDTDPQIQAVAATEGTLWVVTASRRDDDQQQLIQYELATATTRSWLLPASEVHELTVLKDGDLGLIHAVETDDQPGWLGNRTVLDRVRVTGVQAGDQAIVSRISDLTGDHGFFGTDDRVAEAATLLGGTDLLVTAPVSAGGRVPVQRIDDVVPAVGPADATAALSTTTAEAGAPVTVTATSDRAVGVQVQARYTGGGYSRLAARPDLGWHPLALSPARALADGETSLEVPAPPLDGQWELRLATLSADGKTRYAAVPGRLTVSTPAAAPVVTAPTAAAPVTAPRGRSFAVTADVPDAGVVIVEARAAGSSRWTRLDVPAQGVVPAGGSVTVNPVAPATDGTYDLRVSFHGGGSGNPRGAEVAGGLRVVTPPAPSITATPTAGAPLSTWAGGQIRVSVTTNVQASVTAKLIPVGGGSTPPAIPGLSGATFNGTRTANVRAPLTDGTYDLEITATSPGGTTTVREPAAVVVSTPDPALNVLAPAIPYTTSAAAPYTLQVQFNQSGLWTVDTRPSGSTTWVRHPSFLTPRVIQPTATTQSFALTAPGADGNYDLRIGFTNEVGEAVERVFAPALTVSTPDPALTVVSPTAAAPAATSAAGRFDVRLTTDQVVTADLALRPAGGTGTWTAAGTVAVNGVSGQPVTASGTTPYIAGGSYDLRVRLTNAVGRTREQIVTAAVTVANPRTAVNISEPWEFRTLKRRPGTSVQTFFGGTGMYDYTFALALTGTDDWQVIESGRTANTQGFRYGPITVPETPGSYDIRVVATNADGISDTDIARAVLHVGAGPAEPVVINEFANRSGGFVELRNVSEQPVDISGYRIRPCRQDSVAGLAIPAGTVLGPDELWLIGPGNVPGFPVPDQVGGGQWANGGIDFYDATNRVMDAIGSEPGQGCWEGAPVIRGGAADSWSRDDEGTDTDDNADDFTSGPPSPGEL